MEKLTIDCGIIKPVILANDCIQNGTGRMNRAATVPERISLERLFSLDHVSRFPMANAIKINVYICALVYTPM